MGGDGGGRGVRAVGRGGGQRAEHLVPVPGQDLDGAHPDAARGQGARLVDAQRVHAGQDLHRGQLLDQHAAACQRGRAEGEVHGGEQDEPLGDHPDDRGDGQDQGVAPVPAVRSSDPVLGPERQDDDGDQQEGDDLQDPVDGGLDLRDGARELAGGGGDPLGVHVGAHGGRAHRARSGDHGGAGQQPVPRLLLHGARLAREQGLVDLEPVDFQGLAVDGDLVAQAQ